MGLLRRARGRLLPSFGRTVTPFASSKISHMSTNFFMLGKLDVFCLPAVGSRITRSEPPALAVWGRTRARGQRSALRAGRTEKPGCCQGRRQRAGDGECPSVPSVLRGRWVSPVRPRGGHHTGLLGEPSLLTGPLGRSLMPLPLHSWTRPPPLRLHRTPPTSPMGVPQASVPRSGFVPPFPTPSLDRSSLPVLPSPPPLLPRSCPQPGGSPASMQTVSPTPGLLPSGLCLCTGLPHSAPWQPHQRPAHLVPPSGRHAPPAHLATRLLCVPQPCPPTSHFLPVCSARAVTGTDRVFVSSQIHPSKPQRHGVKYWALGGVWG